MLAGGIMLFLLPLMAFAQEEFTMHTLRNSNLEMNVINYGARIQSLKVSGTDVVLGFDTLSHYRDIKQNFGAVVGRYIGRIVGGRFAIDGQEYQLQVSANGDCSHGGTPSFSQRFFTPVCHTDSSLTLRYVSPDGENGFPGQLTLLTTYTLTHDALRIDYEATTTRPTPLNPSNHTFFNLTGDLSTDVLDEMLVINSDSIAIYDSNKRVTGQLMNVTDTPFDFREPHTIGERIDEPNDQLAVTGGYDHCYQLARPAAGQLVHAATLRDGNTNIAMSVYTDMPAMQIYTANGHKGNIRGKGGETYPRRNAICFETMNYPDAPNQPQWPSAILRPGETFRSTTVFRFH